MVSPATAAAAPAHPSLSYAERAKKAQNAKPQPPQRSAGHSTSTITPTASASSTPHTTTFHPTVPSKSTPSIDPEARISSVPTSTPPQMPLPSSSRVASIASTDAAFIPQHSSTVNHLRDNSTHSLPSPAPVQKQTVAPPMNVWKIREEQMAKRAQVQPQTVVSSTAQNQAPTSPLPGPGVVPVVSPGSPPASTDNRSNPSGNVVPSGTNGHLVHAVEYDDPFVVKPGRSASSLNPSLNPSLNASPSSVHPSLNPSPPAIDDVESWPEVSQAAITSPTPSNGRIEGKSKEAHDEESKGQDRESSHGAGLRKSERTKWVPIPLENLQFEGPTRGHHARQRSHQNHRHIGTPPGAPSTSSGQGSQQQSRTHSVTGRRPTPSHGGSVSHSQTQSRTGSVHSSPRHSSTRGGRRLPDEGIAPVFGSSRSLLSSETNSPSTFTQPLSLPFQEFVPSARPTVNTSITSGNRDSSMLTSIPDTATEPNQHGYPAYYPPHIPPYGVSPFHSPRSTGSPASNIYPLPPLGYPGQPSISTIPMSGYGTPPYPMYPPYGYPYGQSYMYWHTPGAPHAISISPMTNPQATDGVPPPTMVARPPPPNLSDAVAGYRDIGFVLPPPVEHRRETTEERGRRTREISFGSIRAGADGTSKSPSPAPPSPILVAVPEGAALGLDVSGEQHSTSTVVVPVQSQHGKDEESQREETGIPVFSIGVEPGEPVPRLRSRTRTQSKGAAATGVSQPFFVTKESEHTANKTLESLRDVAAKATDVDETQMRWEFGTTKSAGGAGAEPTDELAALTISSTNDAVSTNASMPVSNLVPAAPLSAGVPAFVPAVTIPAGPVNGMPSPSGYGARPTPTASEEDWEVRDYGYGYKRDGPPLNFSQATVGPREDRPFRVRDYQHGEPHYRRRGSSQTAYTYDRGRRARGGLSGGYGRGYQTRPYPARGGYSGQNQQRQQAYMPQAQPQAMPQAEVNGFYAPPMPQLATYIPQPYDYAFTPYPPPIPHAHTAGSQGGAAVPLPVPQSNVGFPLDSTRYYLLGQLEYYLSVQNLAQDLYLRQQMDSRGWIPISLIASFNRVRTLTQDPQLVTDVLSLSSLVEVNGAHVRMRQWQLFVLPTAEPSRVEEGTHTQTTPAPGTEYQHAEEQQVENDGAAAHQNHDGEDDEEEDVVFVLDSSVELPTAHRF